MSSKIISMRKSKHRKEQGRKISGFAGVTIQLGGHRSCPDCGDIIHQSEEWDHKRMHHPDKLAKLREFAYT